MRLVILPKNPDDKVMLRPGYDFRNGIVDIWCLKHVRELYLRGPIPWLAKQEERE